MNFPENIHNCGGFTLELESYNEKKRAGFYIWNDISYVRRVYPEKDDVHVLLIDVEADVKICVANIYRSFRPQGLMSADKLFKIQLEFLKIVITPNCFIIGDFTLTPEWNTKMIIIKIRLNYPLKDYM